MVLLSLQQGQERLFLESREGTVVYRPTPFWLAQAIPCKRGEQLPDLAAKLRLARRQVLAGVEEDDQAELRSLSRRCFCTLSSIGATRYARCR